MNIRSRHRAVGSFYRACLLSAPERFEMCVKLKTDMLYLKLYFNAVMYYNFAFLR